MLQRHSLHTPFKFPIESDLQARGVSRSVINHRIDNWWRIWQRSFSFNSRVGRWHSTRLEPHCSSIITVWSLLICAKWLNYGAEWEWRNWVWMGQKFESRKKQKLSLPFIPPLLPPDVNGQISNVGQISPKMFWNSGPSNSLDKDRQTLD